MTIDLKTVKQSIGGLVSIQKDRYDLTKYQAAGLHIAIMELNTLCSKIENQSIELVIDIQSCSKDYSKNYNKQQSKKQDVISENQKNNSSD